MPIEDEIYSIDMFENFLIYGGYSYEVNILDFQNENPIIRIDQLEDSIFFCKFIDEKKAIFVLTNGCTGLIFNYKNIELVEYTIENFINYSPAIKNEIDGDEDLNNNNNNNENQLLVEEVLFKNNILFIGTNNGSIYTIDISGETPSIISIFNNHQNEAIISLDFNDSNIVSISKSLLVETAFSSGKILTQLSINFATTNLNDEYEKNEENEENKDILNINGSILYYNKTVFAIITCNTIEIYKGSKLLYKYKAEGTIESLVAIPGFIIAGGQLNYLIAIDMKNNHRIYKTELKSFISKLYLYNNKTILFTSFDSICGIIELGASGPKVRYLKSTQDIIYGLSYGLLNDGSEVLAACGDNGQELVVIDDDSN